MFNIFFHYVHCPPLPLPDQKKQAAMFFIPGNLSKRGLLLEISPRRQNPPPPINLCAPTRPFVRLFICPSERVTPNEGPGAHPLGKCAVIFVMIVDFSQGTPPCTMWGGGRKGSSQAADSWEPSSSHVFSPATPPHAQDGGKRGPTTPPPFPPKGPPQKPASSFVYQFPGSPPLCRRRLEDRILKTGEKGEGGQTAALSPAVMKSPQDQTFMPTLFYVALRAAKKNLQFC